MVVHLRLVARWGARRSPLRRFVLLSLAAHVLLTAAFIVLPSLAGRRSAPLDPVFVELVAAPPAGPAPTAEVTAPPEPDPAPPEVEPESARLETREPPEPDPLPTPVDKPRPRPEKKPAPPKPEPRPATAQPTRSPDPGEATSGGPGASVTALEIGGTELAWYSSSVTSALYTRWRRPIVEGLFEPLEVRVNFEILRDGRVDNVRVEIPSGIDVLDRSALRAVYDAAPLPPLPRSWSEPRLPASFVFRLHPD